MRALVAKDTECDGSQELDRVTRSEGGRVGRRRNPFRGVMDTMSEMARMREYAEGSGREDVRRTHATAWVPTTDIFAMDDDLKIRCELAGVGPEDVEISLSDGALTIEGERTGAPETTDFYARERYYGHFRRRLKLPQGIDKGAISEGRDQRELPKRPSGDHR
jgi:HSP20 family protein